MSPLQTCPNGHRFNKTSACPSCPQCEASKAPKSGWLSVFSVPARRSLEEAGITTVKKLAKHSRQEVLALHGMGRASLPHLEAALAANGLAFKEPVLRPVGVKPVDVASYLAQQTPAFRKALKELRARIMQAVPGVEEEFAYGMPAYRYHGHPLVYIGAAKQHCALYGTVPPGCKALLKDFVSSKGAVRFTPEKPIPLEAVQAIVRTKAAEIAERWPVKRKRAK